MGAPHELQRASLRQVRPMTTIDPMRPPIPFIHKFVRNRYNKCAVCGHTLTYKYHDR